MKQYLLFQFLHELYIRGLCDRPSGRCFQWILIRRHLIWEKKDRKEERTNISCFFHEKHCFMTQSVIYDIVCDKSRCTRDTHEFEVLNKWFVWKKKNMKNVFFSSWIQHFIRLIFEQYASRTRRRAVHELIRLWILYYRINRCINKYFKGLISLRFPRMSNFIWLLWNSIEYV